MSGEPGRSGGQGLDRRAGGLGVEAKATDHDRDLGAAVRREGAGIGLGGGSAVGGDDRQGAAARTGRGQAGDRGLRQAGALRDRRRVLQAIGGGGLALGLRHQGAEGFGRKTQFPRHQAGLVGGVAAQRFAPAFGRVLGRADLGQLQPNHWRAGVRVAGDQHQRRQRSQKQERRAAGADVGIADRRHELGAQVAGRARNGRGGGVGGLSRERDGHDALILGGKLRRYG